ncbi:MAG: DsbE family thiol:disulfide interchange protein [Hyphomonadaceae bacterium]|nr:DsbE family thiol:disulfide interchange protein [Hyphomonadaceae bacterium]
MRWIAFVPLLALLALCGVSVFLLARESGRERFTEGMVGQPAPAYALARLEGDRPLTNGERAGRAYVVNLFASWCTPCRAEHPQLLTLSRQGVDIVGIAYKDRPEAATAYLAELGNPFTDVGLDPDGRYGLEIGVTGVPETFVIGPDGVIRAAYRGPLTEESVRDVILPALR